MMAKKFSLSCEVNFIPPSKQTPADQRERDENNKRKEKLKVTLASIYCNHPINNKCSISIRYSRHNGKSDSANIIGGILDALQGIVISNDNQFIDIAYTEWEGESDWYQITITEIKR